MRSEKEMFDLIMNTAMHDEHIRAVYMNGSRTNPNAEKDILRDYDIVYAVDKTKPYYEDESWLSVFGDILYMQRPDAIDASVGRECDFDKSYCWLMIFNDGNRIDLHVQTIEECLKDIADDTLCMVLLDKDGILPDIKESSDEGYYVKKPDEAEYAAVCSEFWWCLNNVVKGLYRYEIPYAQDMLNIYVRTQLIKVLSWKAGVLNEWKVSTGKSGKYLYRWLDEDEWERLLMTYSGGMAGEMWQAVDIMCDLFEKTAIFVADKLGYKYNQKDASGARLYAGYIKALQKDEKVALEDIK